MSALKKNIKTTISRLFHILLVVLPLNFFFTNCSETLTNDKQYSGSQRLLPQYNSSQGILVQDNNSPSPDSKGLLGAVPVNKNHINNVSMGFSYPIKISEDLYLVLSSQSNKYYLLTTTDGSLSPKEDTLPANLSFAQLIKNRKNWARINTKKLPFIAFGGFEDGKIVLFDAHKKFWKSVTLPSDFQCAYPIDSATTKFILLADGPCLRKVKNMDAPDFVYSYNVLTEQFTKISLPKEMIDWGATYPMYYGGKKGIGITTANDIRIANEGEALVPYGLKDTSSTPYHSSLGFLPRFISVNPEPEIVKFVTGTFAPNILKQNLVEGGTFTDVNGLSYSKTVCGEKIFLEKLKRNFSGNGVYSTAIIPTDNSYNRSILFFEESKKILILKYSTYEIVSETAVPNKFRVNSFCPWIENNRLLQQGNRLFIEEAYNDNGVIISLIINLSDSTITEIRSNGYYQFAIAANNQFHLVYGNDKQRLASDFEAIEFNSIARQPLMGKNRDFIEIETY